MEELLRSATPRAADERSVFEACRGLLEGSSRDGDDSGGGGNTDSDGLPLTPAAAGDGSGNESAITATPTPLVSAEEAKTFLSRRNFVLRALCRAFGREGALSFWRHFFDEGRWAAVAPSSNTTAASSSATAAPSSPAPAASPASAAIRPIGASATDGKGRVVYADLDLHPITIAAALASLRAVLAPTAPSRERLCGLKVTGRGNRILYEIRAGATYAEREASRCQPEALTAAFGAWLRALLAESSPFAAMLRGLLRRGGGDGDGRGGGSDAATGGVLGEVLLLGCHWIVPKIVAADGGVQPAQAMHTDIFDKGEVLAVAVHASGAHMGTLFDPLGTVFERSDAVLRADSSAFVYDSGGLHCGPGRAHVEGPYPAYDVGRVFFMLASPSLPAASVAAHQANNYLLARPETIQLAGFA